MVCHEGYRGEGAQSNVGAADLGKLKWFTAAIVAAVAAKI